MRSIGLTVAVEYVERIDRHLVEAGQCSAHTGGNKMACPDA